MQLTVTATQIVERSDGQVSDDPNVEPFTVQQVTTDGQIDLVGLPTPATYQISAQGEGFQSQQFQQTLSGGEATALNTVSMGAASGSISGVVVDPAGNRKLTKARSTGRIDGLVALVQALGVVSQEPETEPSVYETEGFFI